MSSESSQMTYGDADLAGDADAAGQRLAAALLAQSKKLPAAATRTVVEHAHGFLSPGMEDAIEVSLAITAIVGALLGGAEVVGAVAIGNKPSDPIGTLGADSLNRSMTTLYRLLCPVLGEEAAAQLAQPFLSDTTKGEAWSRIETLQTNMSGMKPIDFMRAQARGSAKGFTGPEGEYNKTIAAVEGRSAVHKTNPNIASGLSLADSLLRYAERGLTGADIPGASSAPITVSVEHMQTDAVRYPDTALAAFDGTTFGSHMAPVGDQSYSMNDGANTTGPAAGTPAAAAAHQREEIKSGKAGVDDSKGAAGTFADLITDLTAAQASGTAISVVRTAGDPIAGNTVFRVNGVDRTLGGAVAHFNTPTDVCPAGTVVSVAIPDEICGVRLNQAGDSVPMQASLNDVVSVTTIALCQRPGKKDWKVIDIRDTDVPIKLEEHVLPMQGYVGSNVFKLRGAGTEYSAAGVTEAFLSIGPEASDDPPMQIGFDGNATQALAGTNLAHLNTDRTGPFYQPKDGFPFFCRGRAFCAMHKEDDNVIDTSDSLTVAYKEAHLQLKVDEVYVGADGTDLPTTIDRGVLYGYGLADFGTQTAEWEPREKFYFRRPPVGADEMTSTSSVCGRMPTRTINVLAGQACMIINVINPGAEIKLELDLFRPLSYAEMNTTAFQDMLKTEGDADRAAGNNLALMKKAGSTNYILNTGVDATIWGNDTDVLGMPHHYMYHSPRRFGFSMSDLSAGAAKPTGRVDFGVTSIQQNAACAMRADAVLEAPSLAPDESSGAYFKEVDKLDTWQRFYLDPLTPGRSSEDVGAEVKVAHAAFAAITAISTMQANEDNSLEIYARVRRESKALVDLPEHPAEMFHHMPENWDSFPSRGEWFRCVGLLLHAAAAMKSLGETIAD